MDDRYVVSNHNKRILHLDAENIEGYLMYQVLPYDEIEM